MISTQDTLREFYTCFKNRDSEGMARCYHPQIEFSDPVFPSLKGSEVSAMWHFLVSRGKETKIYFMDLIADEKHGSCRWEAVYPYGPKRRMIHNVVTSKFEFQGGKIIRQTDSFDLWKWLGMALGPVGLILGWTPLLKGKVRKLADQSLRNFMLMEAISNHDVNGVQSCLKKGANPNLKLPPDPELSDDRIQPTSPLKLVVFRISDSHLTDQGLKDYVSIAKLLLDHGADPAPAAHMANERYGRYSGQLDQPESEPFQEIRRLIERAKA